MFCWSFFCLQRSTVNAPIQCPVTLVLIPPWAIEPDFEPSGIKLSSVFTGPHCPWVSVVMGEVFSLFLFRLVLSFFFFLSLFCWLFSPLGLFHKDVMTPLSLINVSGARFTCHECCMYACAASLPSAHIPGSRTTAACTRLNVTSTWVTHASRLVRPFIFPSLVPLACCLFAHHLEHAAPFCAPCCNATWRSLSLSRRS